MRKLIAFILIVSVSLGCLCACSFPWSETNDVDVDAILENQKILFVMEITNYDNDYIEHGYFINNKGEKCTITSEDNVPWKSDTEMYEYLQEHYDEFDSETFLNEEELRKIVSYLYCVDESADIIIGETETFDGPYYDLYGIRTDNENEEFLRLEEYGSHLEKLDDIYVEKIISCLEEDWNITD